MARKKTARPDVDAGKIISNQEQAESAGPGIHRVAGVEGLYLKIALSGTGSWFWRYRFAGRRREIGLGARDRVTLAKAINAAKDADDLRRRNIDPIDERRAEIAEIAAKAKAAKPVVFSEATEQYVKDRALGWKHRNARSCWFNPMVKYALPRIGHLSVDAIAIADVVAVVKAAEAAGVPKTGARLRMKPRPSARIPSTRAHDLSSGSTSPSGLPTPIWACPAPHPRAPWASLTRSSSSRCTSTFWASTNICDHYLNRSM